MNNNLSFLKEPWMHEEIIVYFSLNLENYSLHFTQAIFRMNRLAHGYLSVHDR